RSGPDRLVQAARVSRSIRHPNCLAGKHSASVASSHAFSHSLGQFLPLGTWRLMRKAPLGIKPEIRRDEERKKARRLPPDCRRRSSRGAGGEEKNRDAEESLAGRSVRNHAL